MSKKIPNLIIVAGDGGKSGKTTMCRRIISDSGLKELIAIKISPHFHDPGFGLLTIIEKEDYIIYEETNRGTGKDSSAMLAAGAARVYYLQVKEGFAEQAFSEVLIHIPGDTPVICESPSLIEHFDPGIFIIMVSDPCKPRKDISKMRQHDHIEFTLTRLNDLEKLPFRWTGNEWSGI